MFQLFDLRQSPNPSTKRAQDWVNVANGLRQNLKSVQDYYRSHSLAVPAEHFLVTLINSFGLPTSMNLDRYYVNILERADDLGRVLNLTSPISRGKVLKQSLLGTGYTEAVLALNEDFDYESAYQNWREQTPLRCLRHPVSDLSLLTYSKTQAYTDTGVMITSLNIPLLAVMYKGFRNHEQALAKADPEYVQRTVMHFVHMFVLTNMLPSFLDCALFNRVYRLTRGIPLGERLGRHPFHLTDWSSRCNHSQSDILKRLESGKMDMNTMLCNIPLIDEFSLHEQCILPDVAKTRQVMWLLIMARIRYVIWLVEMSQKNGNTQDEGFINRLKRFLIRMKQNNQIITQLPLAFKEELEEDLDDLSSLLGLEP